jgi:hypothetical protein
MIFRIVFGAAAPLLVVAALAVRPGGAAVAAQGGQQATPAPVVPPPPREAAPVDLSGYWAAAITEDWQWRFVTPAKGDYIAVPFNSAGEELAKAWDPEADVAAGLQCKPFGAAAIFRLPTRTHITWQGEKTLRFDFDLGTQTRVAHFDAALSPGERSWQGHATAEWIDLPPPGRGRGGGAARGRGAGGRGAADGAADGDDDDDDEDAPPPARPGGLKMVTRNLRAQYLRMNGVPVSENATITDYIDVVPSPTGEDWLIVKTIVEDPAYLTQPYITSSQFKKEPDGSKWNPTPCEMLPQVGTPAPLR